MPAKPPTIPPTISPTGNAAGTGEGTLPGFSTPEVEEGKLEVEDSTLLEGPTLE